MRSLTSLHAGQGGLVEALFVELVEGRAARVGVVEPAVGAPLDEIAGVGVREHGEDEIDWDGVDGVVVWSGHFGGFYCALTIEDGRSWRKSGFSFSIDLGPTEGKI